MRARLGISFAALCLAAIAGCGSASFDDRVRSLATPSGALGSPDPELPQLIRAIEQQRGLPLQLAATGEASSDSNAAAALAAIYDPALQVELTPKAELLLKPGAPKPQRAGFLRQHGGLIERTADAVDLPRWVFDVEYNRGFFASMRYLDDASLATRLLLLRAQQAMTDKDRPAALADVLRALRVCHALARERRVEARALASSLRHEALEVATDCFYGGLWRRHEAEQLYSLLREELNDWPDDSRMLVGERATVIHAYEAIRAGMLHRLVTLEEHYRLNHHVEELEKATSEEIDADETRYLHAIQRLIDATSLEYSKRVAEIDAATSEIAAPPTLFAATFFARDLQDAIETAALDKATVEAWTLALATAAELVPPPLGVSPHTGRALEVEQNAGRVEIYDGQDVLASMPLLVD